MKIKYLFAPLALMQALLSIQVIWRMLRSSRGERIQPTKPTTEQARVSVIVPVLNERNRLSPCLTGLVAQGTEVAEILVVDGGSTDETQQLVYTFSGRDHRVRLIDASPVPDAWNGKAWGLEVGLSSASPDTDWILTVDADVRPTAPLTNALLAQAERAKLAALSVATLQEIEGIGEGIVHPSMLTTLVYRFGIPGNVYHNVNNIQANGQCFLFSRDALEACNGFLGTHDSVCEDITIARSLVAAGYPVGFYEASELITVNMYDDWRDTWHNWSRSLPMHDRFSGMHTLLGWLEVLLVQALPLPLFLFLVATHNRHRWLVLPESVLAAMRIGVLIGTARAYQSRPWSYWLSPLCDLPVAIELGRNALKRRHTWRGRVLVRGGLS
ncbi:MAG TPA: glycosyltransferase family 2 protein [Ktedonobacteraceae bacterium]|nr:glycosyltransferase family 2 protein [Ktedonobacteraceae bacterium]